MAKVKFDLKDFMLRKGEVVVMGISGLFLAVMLIWGASKWGSAMDPAAESQKLANKSNAVYTQIQSGKPSEEDLGKLTPESWLTHGAPFILVRKDDFTHNKIQFDPTASPNTKRDNPLVAHLTEYQVDMTRSAMLGYDIIFDANNEPLIAVLTTKTVDKIDDAKLKKAADDLRYGVKKNAEINKKKQQNNPPPGMGMGMGMGDPGGREGPGVIPGGNPHGLPGGEFEQSGRRNEKAITYIPLKEIDAAVRAGKQPALTVIPLRLITVHAVVPYKKQLDEIKRALRLPNPPPTAKKEEIEKADAEAKKWGPWYDGFEVQRRVLKVQANGEEKVIQDWPVQKDVKDTSGNYPFEDRYIEKIDTRKVADHFDEGYIPYFLKPEMMLAMPLPQLTKDLNVQYPEVKLKAITDNIDKLQKLNNKKIEPSELAKQIQGSKPKNSIYKPKTADGLEGLIGGELAGKYGPIAGIGMGKGSEREPPMPGSGPGSPRYPEGYGPGTTVANDVDNFLLRFVDCDAKPGYTYQYRFRLRMVNPNFEQKDLVAVPEHATENYKILWSKWTETASITVPAESFLYAHDVKAYRDQIDTAYPKENDSSKNITATADTKSLNKLLQVADNQAVVQVATWMEQVRAGDGNKREPIGAWVVAEMPVGRGEYIGRKQYVKLPLWSSENQHYVLREVTDKVVKGKAQPKGWLVDFSTKSVLVDFEGGRVKTKTSVFFDRDGKLVQGTRTIEEDAGTELLMVRPDGKLVVRTSQSDDADANRKSITTEWTRWVKEVESRKTTTGTGDPMNPFDERPKN